MKKLKDAIEELLIHAQHPDNSDEKQLVKLIQKLPKVIMKYEAGEEKILHNIQHELHVIEKFERNPDSISLRFIDEARRTWKRSLHVEKDITRIMFADKHIKKYLHIKGIPLSISSLSSLVGGTLLSIDHATMEHDFEQLRLALHHIHGVGVVSLVAIGLCMTFIYAFHFQNEAYKESIKKIEKELS